MKHAPKAKVLPRSWCFQLRSGGHTGLKSASLSAGLLNGFSSSGFESEIPVLTQTMSQFTLTAKLDAHRNTKTESYCNVDRPFGTPHKKVGCKRAIAEKSAARLLIAP